MNRPTLVPRTAVLTTIKAWIEVASHAKLLITNHGLSNHFVIPQEKTLISLLHALKPRHIATRRINRCIPLSHSFLKVTLSLLYIQVAAVLCAHRLATRLLEFITVSDDSEPLTNRWNLLFTL